MNNKGQIIKQSTMPDITYSTSCRDCKFNGRCLLDANSRMIKKRCYVDMIAVKLKIKPETVVNRCNSFFRKYGLGDFSFIETIDKDYWLSMSNSQRLTDIRFNLDYYAQRENATITNNDIKILYAVANCYFLAWRNDEYIHCAKCGDLIKNSKQRNRKYCEKCKDKHKTFYDDKIKICIDCGCEFEAFHNREVRCIDCQIKANKSSSRERARRYRERKRNGLERKS